MSTRDTESKNITNLADFKKRKESLAALDSKIAEMLKAAFFTEVDGIEEESTESIESTESKLKQQEALEDQVRSEPDLTMRVEANLLVLHSLINTVDLLDREYALCNPILRAKMLFNIKDLARLILVQIVGILENEKEYNILFSNMDYYTHMIEKLKVINLTGKLPE